MIIIMSKGYENEQHLEFATVYFPDSRPVPEVLTAKEAIHFLRIDTAGNKKPELTLRYYREQGLLKATRIGKNIFYTKQSLMQFLQKQTDFTNRNE